jgi:hypothetical protein
MKISYLHVGVAAACAISLDLHAQVSKPPVAARSSITDSATDQSDTRNEIGTVESSWTIKQIVVAGRRERYAVPNGTSATRTDTPLIEVPQSVQVLTRSLILEQDRRTLGEALVNVSGVVSTRSEEQLLIAPLVRGFPAEVYLDGLPIYAGNQQAFDPTSLVGVERIDVLKGPSATLYGGGLGTPLGVGESKTPKTLRNASDQFFEWTPELAPLENEDVRRPMPEKAGPTSIKRRPRFVVEAVSLLASDTADGQVHLAAIGQYLKRTDPAFTPATYGYSGLLEMLKTYDLLVLTKAEKGHYTVELAPVANVQH